MVEIDGTVWTEAMVRGLVEDCAGQRRNLEDLRLRVAQQAAEVVRAKIDNANHAATTKQLHAEVKALKELSAIDRKRAQEAMSSERTWRGQAVQLRYELEALRESMKESPG
jgi:hypothetical protein